MKYEISFVQYHTYEVEADTEDEAIEEAREEFYSDMRHSVANYDYEDIEVRELK